MLDRLKRDGRYVSDSEFLDTLKSEISDEHAEEHEEILKFFQWLTGAEQEILEQVLIKNHTVEAAADELGLKMDAAKRRLQRAIGHVRDLLHEHGRVGVDS